MYFSTLLPFEHFSSTGTMRKHRFTDGFILQIKLSMVRYIKKLRLIIVVGITGFLVWEWLIYAWLLRWFQSLLLFNQWLDSVWSEACCLSNNPTSQKETNSFPAETSPAVMKERRRATHKFSQMCLMVAMNTGDARFQIVSDCFEKTDVLNPHEHPLNRVWTENCDGLP